MSRESDQSNDEPKSSRVQVLETVQTPLGFFVLVVLVVEAILGVTVYLTTGIDRTICIIGMPSLIVMLVALVSWMAIYRPEALRGARPSAMSQHDGGRSEYNAPSAFKVGDPVRISSVVAGRAVITDDGVIEWDPKMSTYRGRSGRIVRVDGEHPPVAYLLDVDGQQYRWAPEWLEAIR
jgi:hypothetical protein